MQRRGLITAVAATAFCGGMAFAGDVPPPVKKPRDQTGAAITSPQPSSAKADDKSGAEAGVKSVAKAASPASDKVQAEKPASGGKTASGDKSGKGSDPVDKGRSATTPTPAPPKSSAEQVNGGKPGKDAAGKPAPAGGAKPATPEAANAAKPPPPPPAWTPEQIAEAKARCTAQLKNIDAVTFAEAPVREGHCGAPAPVRLVSVGKKPEVVLDPPALLTCDMVAMLATWMKNDVQPLARKHLGADIVKIETMSDYSCRAAYGRKGNKLSEHAHANALDIRGFVTAKASEAMVLEGWGTPQREIAAAKALAEKEAAKAEAIKAAAEKSAAEYAVRDKAESAAEGKDGKAGTTSASQGPASPSLTTRNSIVEGVPKALLPSGIGESTSRGLGLTPSQLGGPKEKKDKGDDKSPQEKAGAGSGLKPDPAKKSPVTIVPRPPQAQPPAHVARFLHETHAAACRLFGTTLGPEANAAHRNHFHVDMAPRQHTKICD